MNHVQGYVFKISFKQNCKMMYYGIMLTWKRKLFHFIQKQPPEVFYKEISQYSQENTVSESLLNKVACFHVYNFMKKWFLHRCFPVNIAKFLRTQLLWRTSENVCFCSEFSCKCVVHRFNPPFFWKHTFYGKSTRPPFLTLFLSPSLKHFFFHFG